MILSIFITYIIYFTVFISVISLIVIEILIHIFGGMDHRTHPQNMNSISIFSHFFIFI